MRKIFTLLFSLIVLSASAFARPDSTCNASFTFSIDNSTNIVQFVAAGANTTIPVEHSWSFGDGTGFFGLFSPNPTHYYVNAGIYQVMHVVTYRSPNDSTAILCSDSVSMIVTIINRAPCNVQANFFTSTNSMFPNDIGFNNTTTGFTNDMQFRWDFGDGTSTNSINHYSTVHTYQQPGTYLACLSVSRDSACSSDTCKVVVIQGPNSCNLVANFSSNADSSDSQLIYFTNTSTPQSNSADSVQWSFGDGTISTENNPSHLYNQPGVYRVCLYINRLNGTSICRSEYCSNVIIDTPQNACNLTASFTYQLSPITVPFSFSFANTSTPLSNVDSSFWNFGDGSAIEVNRNVTTHSFRNPGVYDVCLTVKKVQPGTINTICERQTCQRIIIDTPQTQCNIQAYFGYRPDSTVVNKIYFTNVSSSLEPTDSVFWTFGDGGYSTDVNPVHTYNAGGTYNVCLRIERPQTAGTAPCVREYCGQVLVQQPANPCNLVVNFFDSVVNNNTFYFINQSTPIASTDSIRWSFGDGTSSNDINAIHTYNQPGTYTVCLRVKKAQTSTSAGCVREECHTVVVAPLNPCNLTVNFADSAFGTSVYFVNQSTPLANTDSISWTFGDGTSSTAINPFHVYNAPGTYTVCLRIIKPQTSSSEACIREFCKPVIVSTQSTVCDQLQVNFGWQIDQTNNRRFLFTNQSSPVTANTYTSWSFGDGDSSTAYNPAHTYAQPGTYLVCLRVGIPGTNCVRDTCRTVVVSPTIDSCHIQPAFISHADSFNNRTITFINTTAGASATSYAEWTFGDGTANTGWNISHTYAVPGWYLVCLTTVTVNGCTGTYCDSVFVPGNVIPPYNCDSFQLQVGYRRDENLPNKFFFYATGNAPVYNQQWSFIKLNPDSATVVINQNTPVFVFPDTGLYRVCVRGIFSTNCAAQSCTDVRIASTLAPVPRFVRSYPNPAHNNVSFNLQLSRSGLIYVTVLSLNNVEIMSYSQQGTSGNNTVTLNVRKLTPGFYVARIRYPDGVSRTRFVKF